MATRLLAHAPLAERLLESSGAGLYLQDFSTGEHVWSPRAREIFGVDDDFVVTPESFVASVHEEDRRVLFDRVAEAHAQTSPTTCYQVEFRIQTPRCSVRWLRVSTHLERAPDGHVQRELGVIYDITLQRDLEQELAAMERRLSLDSFAGGIAHDFNNLLSAILGESHLARVSEPLSEPLLKTFRAIEAVVERANLLTTRLLTYARGQLLELRTLRLSRAVASHLPVLRRVIPEGVTLNVDLGDGAWPVRVDETTFQQVLVNLVLNASEAMEGRGEITLSARCERLDAERPSGLSPGDHVLLCVADEGPGMTPEILQTIFQPFWTTKVTGTGLGLPTSKRIIEQLGGALIIDSQPGAGTRATIFFPCVDPATLEEVERAEETSLHDVARHGHYRVLLAEDESIVREVTIKILKSLDFSVVAVEDGDALMRALAATPEAFDAIVSDVVMPGHTPQALRAAIAQLNNRLPVLFLSGYASLEWEGETTDALLFPRDRFLNKPASPTVLAQTLRKMILASRAALADP